MTTVQTQRSPARDTVAVRVLAEQAFSRAAGAPLIEGNAVDLLIDARANFDAWLAAIRAARSTILFENYIFRDDDTGRAFRDALCERAKAGVRVFVVRDWMGCLGQSRHAFWKPLADAGGEVRTYNPPRFTSPFGWFSRDHRKLLVCDNDVGFLGGICVSGAWLGDAKKGIDPWRDTAVSVRGPAMRDLATAFADTWATLGDALPDDALAIATNCLPAGQMDLRVVATVPNTAGLYRLDQLIAAMARRSLWITDAYFVGVAPYVQALSAAARDGVDVRLLVPGTSDIPAVGAMSRAGYRPLLEAGIRVFEWNGSMLHAKTAVADGRWARVGSSNLNLASWIGNCELDVAIEDENFAQCMEAQYDTDLGNATEIVLKLPRRRRWKDVGEAAPQSRDASDASEARSAQSCAANLGQAPEPIAQRREEPSARDAHPARSGPPYPRARGGSSGRAAAGAMRLANTVGAANSNRRVLGKSESGPLMIAGLFLLVCSAIGFWWPRVVAWPLAVVALWVGASLVVRYFSQKGNSK
jgi:cardiolipin synthase